MPGIGRSGAAALNPVVERPVGTGRIVVRLADLTTLTVDAMVNAANAALAGGGGVDGAIHRVGGPAIMAELQQRYDGCPTGLAVITGAGRLPARYVIHAVGPRWRGGSHGESEELAAAYRSAFRLASEYGLQTVATASISTGIYGFPLERAVPTALTAATEALEEPGTSVREITWALVGDTTLEAFRRGLDLLA